MTAQKRGMSKTERNVTVSRTMGSNHLKGKAGGQFKGTKAKKDKKSSKKAGQVPPPPPRLCVAGTAHQAAPTAFDGTYLLYYYYHPGVRP